MKISETVEFLHEVGGVTIRLTLQQAGRDLLVLLTGVSRFLCPGWFSRG